MISTTIAPLSTLLPLTIYLISSSSPLLLLSLSSIPSAAASTHQHDVNALLTVHASWSANPSYWDTSTDPCEKKWVGVFCDSTNTRVTKLLLINQRLNGVLPAAIGDLTNLTDLDLSSNPRLRGTLPNEIGKLTNLRRLFVQFCNFSGSIPSAIGKMTQLRFLGLTQNSFAGPLPASIGLLKYMIWLDLSSNSLVGSLPDSISSGTGSGLNNLTNAVHLHLQNNFFSGTIPGSIFNSQMQLVHLTLNDNFFTGRIPSTIGDLAHVRIVRLDSNNLNGSIPSTISKISNLTTLQLNNNALSGSLPDLSNNTNLQMLELGYNKFTASAIPAWIANLTNLLLLSLQSANLIGGIPAEIFALPNITNVTLGSNRLNGTLYLTAPSSKLLLVNVTNNEISGLDEGTYTQELLLNGNPYCRSNPNICTTTRSGRTPVTAAPPPIATSTSDCTNRSCPADYSINPRDSGDCQCARPVKGSGFFPAIEIPVLTDYYISLMEQHVADGLSKNVESNQTFRKSQVVVQVVSNNNVTVSVFPPKSTSLWLPNEAADISYVLKNQDVDFFVVGAWLCGFNGTPYDLEVIAVYKLSAAAKIGIGVGVSVFAVAMMVIVSYYVKQKSRAEKAEKQNKPFASWIAESEGGMAEIPRLKGARWFSLDEIKKCTNNFSRNNEIGEGGYGKVYKGYLLSGERVAIKRARTNSLQGATEFKTEIELLSRVHHRNLVGLIGFCFEEAEQILVYEYMPNGTIQQCLSGRTELSMDWERRIAVALDSARGIAYLHSEAHPPIIHRDIKSSNILLDEKLVAKVADFGISMQLGSKENTSTEVKGTLGYLDPDYIMTNVYTEKSDVYSFGVVLLELVTGRAPIQGGKSVVREVKMVVENGGLFNSSTWECLLDGNLMAVSPPIKALHRLVEVALSCVEDDPASRPSMGKVVKELEVVYYQTRAAAVACMDVEMSEDPFLGRYRERSLSLTKSSTSSSFELSGRCRSLMPR